MNLTELNTQDEVAESSDYEREAAPHRRAALENWRLIAMHQQSIG